MMRKTIQVGCVGLALALFLGIPAPSIAEEDLKANQAESTEKTEKEKPRKFFEYKGDYREEITRLKEDFHKAFGYKLLDLDRGWRPDEIKRLHNAFSRLSSNFHHLPDLKGLYRISKFESPLKDVEGGRIPAATFPKFNTLYRQELKKRLVYIQDDSFRLEFYDPAFSEDDADLINVVHHEMGHAFDIAHGFLSFTDEWLTLSGFHVLNLPPLDAQPGADFLYALVNDANNRNYAPVSKRHLATYSRENPQEDFANSIVAYLHYPYFQYSHPKRYRFLKTHVFGDKDIFPPDPNHPSFLEKVKADADAALVRGDAKRLFEIAVEVGRNHTPEVEEAVVATMRRAMDTDLGRDGVQWLAWASCYLYVPGALDIRQDLARQQRVTPEQVLKHERCLRMGLNVFEQDQIHWPVLNIYFFLEGDRAAVQFLDPVMLTAQSRKFNTRYFWNLSFGDEGGAQITKGMLEITQPVTGSVKIDLQATASKPFKLPSGILLKVEIRAERYNLKTGQRFTSTPSLIQFVAHPWFEYLGPTPPHIEVRYPQSLMHLERQAER